VWLSCAVESSDRPPSRSKALAAIEESVSVYRRLAEARPDAVLPKLASSLNEQAERLGALGRRESALAAVEEAVAIRRRLVAANADAFLPDLAESLNEMSVRLGKLGRREDALAAIEEAASVYRGLAGARPDAFLLYFATAMNDKATWLRELGRPEQARSTIEDAIYTTLPALELRSDSLPGSGHVLLQSYFELCEEVEQEPEDEIMQRMSDVLAAAGLLPSEDP